MTSDCPMLTSIRKNSFDFTTSTMLAEFNDSCDDMISLVLENSNDLNSNLNTTCKYNKIMKTIGINDTKIIKDEPHTMNDMNMMIDDDMLLYSIADLDDLFSSSSYKNNNETQFYMNDENDALNIDSFALSLFAEDGEFNNSTTTMTNSEISTATTTTNNNNGNVMDVINLNIHTEEEHPIQNDFDIPITDTTIEVNKDYDRLIQLMGLSSGALNCLNTYNQNIQPSVKKSNNEAYLPKHKCNFKFSQRLIIEQPSPELIDSRLPYIYIPKMDLTNDNNYSHPLSKKFTNSTTSYTEKLNKVELKKDNTKAYRQRSIQLWLAKRKRRKYRNTSSIVYHGLSLAACKKQRSKGKFVKETHWISIS